MSDEQLKGLLKALQAELKQVDQLDEESAALARQLESDIHQLVDQDAENPALDAMVDKANELEATFASRYPLLERTLREVVDVLGRMGI